MRPTARIAVIYYSATATVHRLAQAFVDGAADAEADVRLRRIAELAPDHTVEAKPRWREHLDATAHVPLATRDDLRWADGFAFGTPARFGDVCAQLRRFLDTASVPWQADELAGKPATGSARWRAAPAATPPTSRRSRRRPGIREPVSPGRRPRSSPPVS
jgi:NAD(P)H dehydrogenase (quinone)